MFSKSVFHRCFILFMLIQPVFASIEFGRVPLCAGKQLLTEKGFYLSQTLGIARITPQAEIPFILSYKSTNEEMGIFGKGWRSNLLESSVSGDLWHTPWGEVIKLSENGSRFKKIDRVICGINEYEGWEFLYLFGKLQKIVTPNKKELIFVYDGPEKRISAVRTRNFDFIRLFYQDKLVVKTIVGGVTSELKYRNRELLRSVQTSNLHPVEFRYNGQKKLIRISRKDYVDKLTLDATGELLADCYYFYKKTTNGIKITDQTGTSNCVIYQNHLLTTEDAFGNCIAIKFLDRFDPAYPGQPETIHLNGKLIMAATYLPHTEQATSITDRFGNKLRISYNEKGLPVKYSRQATGEKKENPFRTTTYNRWKLPEKIIELASNGNIRSEMEFKYDDDRQVAEVKTGKQSIRFRYNPFGYVNAMSGPHGDFRSIYYDGSNRPLLDVGVLATKMTYNNAGFLSEFRTINSEDKIVSGGRITYDFYGNPARVKLHDGRIIKYERDAFGRILKQHQPDGHSISYGYGTSGNLEKVVDPNGHTLNFIYEKNRLMKQITPAGQITEYEYNSLGLPISVLFYFADKPKKIDCKLTYRYDVFDRISKIDFGNGYSQNHQYDEQSRLVKIQRISPEETRSAVLTYDAEGRLIRREESIARKGNAERKIVYSYEFDEKGRRTLFSIKDGTKDRKIEYAYNEDGFLEEILSGDESISYEYEDGKLVKEIVNGTPISYQFDVLGRLLQKKIGTTELKYFWSPEGRLIGRDFAGKRQLYFYDKLEQLESVTDNGGKVLEYYKYDPAGNIIERFANGVKSTFVFDKANQLVSGQVGKKKYRYQYDAAGRMISDGHTRWQYGWLNSVVKADQISYSYDISGQLASAGNDTFLWDNLALLERNGILILNTPSMTGGNPVLVGEKIIFHDMLGSSIGIQENKRFSVISRSGFGEIKESVSNEWDYFTGKPKIDGLGYHFLLRNYAAASGKWTNSDPLGYPDGWNNFSYVNNRASILFDPWGGVQWWNALKSTVGIATNGLGLYFTGWSGIGGIYFGSNLVANSVNLAAAFYDKDPLSSGNTIIDCVQGASYAITDNDYFNEINVTGSLITTVTSGGTGLPILDYIDTTVNVSDLGENLMLFFSEKEKSMKGWQKANSAMREYNYRHLLPSYQQEIIRNAKNYSGDDLMNFKDLTQTPPKSNTSMMNRFSNSYATYEEALAHQKMNKTVEKKQQGMDYTVEIPDHAKIIKVVVWDYLDQDGDVVAIYQKGKNISGDFVILNQPKVFTLSVDNGDIEVRGIKDGGGGGVTYATQIWIQTSQRPVRFDKLNACQNSAPPGTVNRYTFVKTSEKEVARGGGD